MTAIHTIGHSTRPLDDFVALLRREGIRHVADVRAHPGSRRHPHFHRDALARALPEFEISYSHHPELGGRRRPLPGSPNGAWRNASFRAYADYMGTEQFRGALDSLIILARAEPLAIMCAEAVPWRCHRWLISDALVARDIDVHHILESKSERHALTRFAVVHGDNVTYPLDPTSPEEPDLFT